MPGADEEESPVQDMEAEQRQPAEMMNITKVVEEGDAPDPVRKTSNTVAPTDMAPYARATSEQYALDSYQNLIFSIARFKE